MPGLLSGMPYERAVAHNAAMPILQGPSRRPAPVMRAPAAAAAPATGNSGMASMFNPSFVGNAGLGMAAAAAQPGSSVLGSLAQGLLMAHASRARQQDAARSSAVDKLNLELAVAKFEADAAYRRASLESDSADRDVRTREANAREARLGAAARRKSDDAARKADLDERRIDVAERDANVRAHDGAIWDVSVPGEATLIGGRVKRPEKTKPTAAQVANNREIQTARDQLESMRLPMADLMNRTREDIGFRPNPDYNPTISGLVRTATQHKVGRNDPSHAEWVRRFAGGEDFNTDPVQEISLPSGSAAAAVPRGTPAPTPTAVPTAETIRAGAQPLPTMDSAAGLQVDASRLQPGSIYQLPDGSVVEFDGEGFIER